MSLSRSTAPICVAPARTRHDRGDFVAVPHKLYARDPSWVARTNASAGHALNARRNPFYREAFVEHFLARDARGECVGRIAAIIHPAHVRRHGRKAFFGQLECTDDARVAERLLAAVEDWGA